MQGKKDNNEWFSRLLLNWNIEKNNRKMPWKGEKDPYKIWLSEIILQQTRVAQGYKYYNKLIKAFPDIITLSKASDDKVFKMWEGLGYYSRCKNLLSTARFISKDLNGEFPKTYEKIKTLKGVGPYTAAAIASFAFNLPYAVLDGNVFRVLSRVFGIKKPIDTSVGKKIFSHLADQLLDKKYPGMYNQAIMDLGAVICKPSDPQCNQCPFQQSCFAFNNNKINFFPVKEKKIKIKHRWFYYLVLEYRKKIVIVQRTKNDIWKMLYEFPQIETFQEKDSKELLRNAIKEGILITRKYELQSVSPAYKQKLSHQVITGKFLKISLKQRPVQRKDWVWIKYEQLKHYAFPAIINQFQKQTVKK